MPESGLGRSILNDLQVFGNDSFGQSRSILIHSQDQTFGVPLAEIRKLVRKHLKNFEGGNLEEEAIFLLNQPFFDSKVAGIQILATLTKSENLDIHKIDTLIKHIAGWALVDTLATDVVTPELKNNLDEVNLLIDWAVSNDPWLRRCAIVSLIKVKKHVQDWSYYKNLMLKQFIQEKDPYVLKAVKWLIAEKE